MHLACKRLRWGCRLWCCPGNDTRNSTGLFSNEAGMGSAPNAAASAAPYPPHPASQGYVQMLVYLWTPSLFACDRHYYFIIWRSESGMDNINGIELTQLALSSAVGSWGSTFIAIAIFFCIYINHC